MICYACPYNINYWFVYQLLILLTISIKWIVHFRRALSLVRYPSKPFHNLNSSTNPFNEQTNRNSFGWLSLLKFNRMLSLLFIRGVHWYEPNQTKPEPYLWFGSVHRTIYVNPVQSSSKLVQNQWTSEPVYYMNPNYWRVNKRKD